MASTLLQILDKTADFFKSRNIENPRLDAEYLLAHGLNCKRLDLYLRFDEVLSDEILNKLRTLVKRRSNKEPLQYILGEVDFYNVKLKVDKRVLIPRPETEYLVEKLVQHYKEKFPKRILDLGTGSGAIILALTKAFEGIDFSSQAVDVSEEALKLAQENALLNKLDGCINFINSSWLGDVSGRFDLIVSNPPYLTKEEWETAQEEVKDFEPISALVAESEGLSDLTSIISEAIHYLLPDGMLVVETGINQHEALMKLGKEVGYSSIESWKDLLGRDRFLVFIMS